MKKILISDFTTKEIPHGGSEWVNDVLIQHFNLNFQYSNKINFLDKKNFYIISNISLMNPNLVKELHKLNYIIIENDYKILKSRHPWRYPNSIVPMGERINYELYANAKAVFVQTKDHLDVFLQNDVKANFINLESSIWSTDDLNLLRKFNQEKNSISESFAIYNTNNWIKNTLGNIKFCVENNLKYILINETNVREDFLKNISSCKGLVFFPIARETYCRLVVEAKCMDLEIITSQNYGASREVWFNNLSGLDLINFLEKNTNKNLNIIGDFLP